MPTYNAFASPSRTSKDPNAMDINYHKNCITLAKLTPAESEKCMKEGKCFACQEKGHSTCDCPQKSQMICHPQVKTAAASLPTDEQEEREPTTIKKTAAVEDKTGNQ